MSRITSFRSSSRNGLLSIGRSAWRSGSALTSLPEEKTKGMPFSVSASATAVVVPSRTCMSRIAKSIDLSARAASADAASVHR
ncbi:hypothetical protein D3C83_120020 [compost metagenome]